MVQLTMQRTTAVDLAGLTFGKLIAARPTTARSGNNVVWECRCECGAITNVHSGNLRKGNTKSCGCLKKLQATKHGHTTHLTASREYSVWASMRRRCDNPNNPRFPRYGARGIKVCERWTRFENFIADMGPCPYGLTIERINNAKGYQPDNCKWATYGEQNRNSSQTRRLTLSGVTLCLQDWCKRTGLTRNDINRRLRKGWTDEKILTTPVHRYAPRRH